VESGENASIGCPWFMIGWRQLEEFESTVEQNEIIEMRLK
jgi:hypothetical protein